jgi:hypothetical protein
VTGSIHVQILSGFILQVFNARAVVQERVKQRLRAPQARLRPAIKLAGGDDAGRNYEKTHSAHHDLEGVAGLRKPMRRPQNAE